MLSTAPATVFQPIINEGRVLVGPTLAAQILAKCEYSNQRKVQEWHIDDWVYAITNNRFRDNEGSLTFARLNGVLYLINGYHRLNAIVRAGREFSFNVRIVDVQSLEKLHDEYGTIDTVDKPRTLKDIIVGHDMIDEDITINYLSAICEAAAIIDGRFRNVAPAKRSREANNKQARAASGSRWIAEARVLKALLKGQSKIGKNATFFHSWPLAISLVILHYEPGTARNFISMTMANNGLRKGEPSRALLEAWSRPGVRWTRYEKGQLMQLAWNAFYKEQEVHIIKIPKGAEFYLEGVPY
jgi:hypothetical protein